MGKLSQAIAHGATLLQVDGNFDDCLTLARKLAEAYPVELVNSVNPARIEGQKTAAFEVVDALGDAPDIHCLPVGNAGNITAYWRATASTASDADGMPPGRPRTCPAMWGFQAAGAAPIVLGHPVDHPETIATAIRIGNPASWAQAVAGPRRLRRAASRPSPTSRSSPRTGCCPRTEGVFVEPASAASVAGLLRGARGRAGAGRGRASSAPSPATASRTRSGRCGTPTAPRCEPTRVPVDAFTAAGGARPRGLTAVRPWPAAATGGPGARPRRAAPTSGPGFDSIGLALGIWDDYARHR